MKLSKLFVLAVSSMMLIACGGNAKESKAAGNTSAEAPVSGEAPASAEVGTSSAAANSEPSPLNTYTVNFYDTVAAANTNGLNDALKDFVNQNTTAGFVTAVENESSQVASVDAITPFTCLQIGSSSKKGNVKFTFSKTVKSVVLNLESYNKTYINGETGEQGISYDTSSKLYVNSDDTVIDLKASDNTPTTKTETVTVNSTTLDLYVKASKNRVFVKSITFNL